MPKKLGKIPDGMKEKMDEEIFSDIEPENLGGFEKEAKIGVVRGQNVVRIPQIVSAELDIEPGDFFKFIIAHDPEKPDAKPELKFEIIKSPKKSRKKDAKTKGKKAKA